MTVMRKRWGGFCTGSGRDGVLHGVKSFWFEGCAIRHMYKVMRLPLVPLLLSRGLVTG